ncbi:MAG: hypothetical protein IID09_02160 [Candidatus Hydrogenedentes bacterium]|nr:hypothetical protein [Candidatus Hydrogenedentota bacterium]
MSTPSNSVIEVENLLRSYRCKDPLIDERPNDLVHLTDVIPAAAFLPIAPLATVPLIMHFARHR